MVHAMNNARRDAFDLMRCQSATRYVPRKLARTYAERDVMSESMAHALEDLGWLTRCPGRRGRPTIVTLTDVGLWILGGAQ